MVARDVYSILHFPIIFGIVLLAVGFEEAILHPSVSLPVGADLSLAAGVVLFVGGAHAALHRAAVARSRRWPAGLVLVGVGIIATQSMAAPWTLAAVAVGASVAASLSR